MNTGIGLRATELPIAENLEVEIFDPEVPFHSHRAAWTDLASQLAESSPYVDWSWVLASAEARSEARWWMFRVRDGATIVAMVPFYLPSTQSRLHLRRLMQAGYSGKIDRRSMTEGSIALVLPGYEDKAWRAISRAVARLVQQGEADCAIFRTPDQFRPYRGFGAWAVLAATRGRCGTNVVELPETWAEYRKLLGKSMRDNLAYYPRRIEKAGFESLVEYRSDAAAVDTLIGLHKTRAEHEHRLLGDYFQSACQRETLVRAHQAGGGFVALLTLNGQPVAAQAFLQNGNTLLASYSGFNSEYSNFSPLFVLQAATFQKAHAEGVRRLDLLRGKAAWQVRWGASVVCAEQQAVFVSIRPTAIARTVIYLARRSTLRLRSKLDGMKTAGQNLLAHARLLLMSSVIEGHAAAIRLSAMGLHNHLVHVRR